MYSLDSLNEIQKKVAMDTDGAIMVTAGAGSGKTRLLTHRICYLIEEMGVSPYNILAITFTNKATNEMKERINTMIDFADGVTIRTFHSLCALILRENIEKLGTFTRYFTVYDDADQEKLLKKVITDLKIDADSIKCDIACHISNAKNLGLGPNEYRLKFKDTLHIKEICDVYFAYQEELKNCNALDFDDLLLKTMELLLNNEDVCSYYQDKFQYILVDEFQDTNVVQYNLVRVLSAKWGNVFVVGDEDQCIYSWRGANITNIQNFLKDYADARLYKLEQNYRSTKNILNMANRLIKYNVERLDKTLFTENEEGSNINYFEAESESEEAEYVAKCIAKLYSLGVPYKDIGVLMRISALSRHFEEKLLNYNIPYVTSGIFKFFDRLEIKNILSYLKLLINPKDNVSLTRIINFPKRGIGDATVDKIQELAVSHNTHMLDIIENFRTIDDMPSNIKSKIMEFSDLMVDLKANYENMGLTEIVKYVIEKIEIKGLYNTKSEEDIDRTMNIDQLIQSVMTYENNNDEVSLVDYIEGVTLANSVDKEDAEDSVNVSTVHASKGLEFEYVFIVGAEEGRFPLSRAMDTPSEMEEERRLMYVAVTRAKKKLTITRAKSRFLYGTRNSTMESRFMKEAGLSRELLRKQQESLEKKEKPKVDTLNIMQSIKSSLNPSISIDNKVNNESEFQVGARVIHTKLGIGTITSTELVGTSSYVTVDFGKPTGIKKLATKFAPIKIYKGN
ncbi:MAG: UvrD-helicase domain-containing protein [Clostridia bacterium]|nr:UvrD-helicase domain-containing protein [Clostridia bacterium]